MKIHYTQLTIYFPIQDIWYFTKPIRDGPNFRQNIYFEPNFKNKLKLLFFHTFIKEKKCSIENLMQL